MPAEPTAAAASGVTICVKPQKVERKSIFKPVISQFAYLKRGSHCVVWYVGVYTWCQYIVNISLYYLFICLYCTSKFQHQGQTSTVSTALLLPSTFHKVKEGTHVASRKSSFTSS